MKRAAIYDRLQSADCREPESQLRQLRAYAERRGFALVEEFIDHTSGGRTDRERFRKLLEKVRCRQIDVVLVWRYDRFARSMHELVNSLAELAGLGVDFISYSQDVDTTSPEGKLLFDIMVTLAEFERSLTTERVKAGMRRAKAQGKHTGRPALPAAKRSKIEELLRRTPRASLRSIAREVGVSAQTVKNVQSARAH